jgi:hypothetical protein
MLEIYFFYSKYSVMLAYKIENFVDNSELWVEKKN